MKPLLIFFPQNPVIYTRLGLNIPLSTLFSNILIVFILLEWNTKFYSKMTIF
jgi:hypothetical protein